MKSNSTSTKGDKLVLKLITLFTFISFLPKLYAQDSFSLDEFSEGLDISDESIAVKKETPTTTATTNTKVKVAPEDKEFEKIAVTGSHIKRINGEGASPIFTVDRAMIEQSGHNSVSDVLRDMTASSFGGMREASGSNAAGVATVNLRGLGSDKTLVLLNGKRLPKDAVTGSVDLNLIPLAAVKRIEVLKDGASATYGSDALGGVVNIITHKDYNGSQISYQESFTKYVGGTTKQADFVTGSATSKSYMTTVLSFRENENIFSKDRPWTANGISLIGSPGSYKDDSGKWKPDSQCDSSAIEDGGDGNEFCGFTHSDYSDSMPNLRQLNLMTLFEYEINSDLTFYGRLNGTKKDVQWQYAPAPGQFSIDASVASTLGISGYSGGDVTLRYRTVELGNRVTEIDTYSLGFQTGLKGSLTDTWDWDLSFDRNTVYKNDLGVSGYGLESRITELIKTGKFNPFDTNAETRGSLESARYQPWQLSRSENNFYEMRFSGELFDTKNGAVGAAIGSTYTEEKFSTTVDQLSANDEVFASAGSSGEGKRNTKSVYIETIAPIGKSAELQLAGRYDEFSDFGSTTNPKLGFKWNITNSFLVRASAGTGFKAPQLKDLYAAASDGYQSFIDRVACANETSAGGTTPSCVPKQWRVKSGGNDSLKEEKSESYNIGMVYQPSKRNSIGFDTWLTKLNNVVDIDYAGLTQFEQNGGDLSKYGITVNRDGGYITSIEAPLLNLGSLEISGIDLNTQYAVSNAFTLKMNHSHLFYYKKEGFPGTGYENILNSNGYPAWRNNITLEFAKGSATIALIAKTVGQHDKAVKEEGELPAYTEYDLNYTQGLGRSTTITFGVQNLFGTTPPLDESNSAEKLNADLYNPRGQLAFVGFKQRF